MEKKKNGFVRFLTNIYVRNIALMVIVFLALGAIVLFWINIHTKHGQEISVPPVKGLQMEEARGILTSADLSYEVIDSIFTSGGTPGAIIEQIPKEYSKVKEGRTIYLRIQAKGIQTVPIPELRDFSRRQAEAQLKSLGFDNIIIQEVPSVYAGIVISISYKGKEVVANQKIPKGATLRMKVGAGGESADDSMPETNIKIEDSFSE